MSGTHSLQVTGDAGGMYQDISGLLPGGVYLVSARAQASSSTSGQATLYIHDTAGGGVVTSEWKTPSSTNWDCYTAYFTATSTGKIRIHLHYGGTAGTIRWDDVSVSKVY